ncbi:L-dopachrome tautomerase-related protein [Hymenobacter sp. BT491]|uniref:L-dopachrome tautomerase-related protein n=1 Tax=Hymenobacter sp. BT491 TaxID=2766779 RepID=UPI001653C90B|nr:L-dopachrome tautomerase-related protein [Hymenobacter sp. BT491]MBC6991174.1 hypothetical protein [Hymenobacter sp. BT491]
MLFPALPSAAGPLRVATFASLLALLAAQGCSSPSQPTSPTDAASATGAAADSSANKGSSALQLVAELRGPQFVGVAVTHDGRVLADFPRWDYNPVYPIALVGSDNSVKPYPDASWCMWNDSVKNEPQKHWICPQSVHVDQKGTIWVLDPAAPGLKYTVVGGPKLVKIDPKTNKVVQTISFPESVVPRKAYLNDVRIDTQRNIAYITESGIGSLIVVDLASGKARKALSNHPSVKADKSLQLKADGHLMVDAKGKPMQLNADGIALSRDFQYLYYMPLTSHKLYRIKTEALRNAALSDAQVGQQVEDLGTVPASDGLEIDASNNVYLTSFETNSLVRRTPAGKIETLVQDKRLQWPDTYSLTPNNELYVTTSAIHKTPNWNKGVSMQDQPFHIFKMALPK